MPKRDDSTPVVRDSLETLWAAVRDGQVFDDDVDDNGHLSPLFNPTPRWAAAFKESSMRNQKKKEEEEEEDRWWVRTGRAATAGAHRRPRVPTTPPPKPRPTSPPGAPARPKRKALQPLEANAPPVLSAPECVEVKILSMEIRDMETQRASFAARAASLGRMHASLGRVHASLGREFQRMRVV